MEIKINIPNEFANDYNSDRFKEFFSRVIVDIDNEGMCGNYEKETAEMFLNAFDTSVEFLSNPTPNGEECREAINKQIPKIPSHKYVKYGKHKWKRKDNGEIDDWAWDFEFCNGVVCERCGESVCVHCNPNYDDLEDCEVNIYNCPSCNKKVYCIQKYCDCGQKLDWGDKE